MHEMFRLWCLSEEDLLSSRHSYRCANKGRIYICRVTLQAGWQH